MGGCLQTGAGVSRDKSGNNRHQTTKRTLDNQGVSKDGCMMTSLKTGQTCIVKSVESV